MHMLISIRLTMTTLHSSFNELSTIPTLQPFALKY